MFQQFINEARIDFTFTPKGPVLIRTQTNFTSRASSSFVRTFRDGIHQVYFPGTSLKGVMRNFSERMVRSFHPHAACPTLEKSKEKDDSGRIPNDCDCSHAIKTFAKKADPVQIYQTLCLICRCFGSLHMAGRLNLTDAYLLEKEKLEPEVRNNVGISRLSGASAGQVLFSQEALTQGTFAGQLHLRNFEWWQLGLALAAVYHFTEGQIPIGACTSRGMGRVQGQVKSVTLETRFLDRDWSELVIPSFGSVLPKLEAKPRPIPAGISVQAEQVGLRNRWLLEKEADLELLREDGYAALVAFLKTGTHDYQLSRSKHSVPDTLNPTFSRTNQERGRR